MTQQEWCKNVARRTTRLLRNVFATLLQHLCNNKFGGGDHKNGSLQVKLTSHIFSFFDRGYFDQCQEVLRPCFYYRRWQEVLRIFDLPR